MVAESAPREFAFIIATDEKKPDGKTRRMIRREVMKGKNKGKTLPPRRPKVATARCSQTAVEQSSPPSDHSTPSSSTMSLDIPARVGSDMSFYLVAGERIDASVLTPIIKFAMEAKPAMFVLQSYFDFPRNPTAWSEALNSDPAYLNAVLSASHAYYDYLAGMEPTTVHQRLHSSRYLSRCLQILRERLSDEDDNLRLADTTVMAILCLASYSSRVRQEETSSQHLKGLRQIIDLRGGIRSMRGNSKLLIETFRCDISLALNSGRDPIFFHNPQLEPFLPYLDQLSGFLPSGSFCSLPADFFIGDRRLQRAWDTTSTFCSLVKYAAQEKRRIPQETFLNTMASVMYRLLAINDLDHFELDGAFRLGLLGFCSRIFVQWTKIRVPHRHLSQLYRESLSNLRSTGQASPDAMLWLLFIGHVSVFLAEDEIWLVPYIRDAIRSCGLKTWEEVQAILNSYLWIDHVHSEYGEAIFDQAFSSNFKI